MHLSFHVISCLDSLLFLTKRMPPTALGSRAPGVGRPRCGDKALCHPALEPGEQHPSGRAGGPVRVRRQREHPRSRGGGGKGLEEERGRRGPRLSPGLGCSRAVLGSRDPERGRRCE